MTHDELLAKLYMLPADVSELQHGARAVQALRAVVELCRKWESEKIYFIPSDFIIKAIEKELNG